MSSEERKIWVKEAIADKETEIEIYRKQNYNHFYELAEQERKKFIGGERFGLHCKSCTDWDKRRRNKKGAIIWPHDYPIKNCELCGSQLERFGIL